MVRENIDDRWSIPGGFCDVGLSPSENIVKELEEELKDKYTFAKLNVDEAREIAIAYNISSVPTFLFIKDNKVASQERGYMSKEDLKSKIEELLG